MDIGNPDRGDENCSETLPTSVYGTGSDFALAIEHSTRQAVKTLGESRSFSSFLKFTFYSFSFSTKQYP